MTRAVKALWSNFPYRNIEPMTSEESDGTKRVRFQEEEKEEDGPKGDGKSKEGSIENERIEESEVPGEEGGNDGKSESFSLAEKRKEIQKQQLWKLRSKNKLSKALSVKAFALPDELLISENEVNDWILKMIGPDGIPRGKRKILLKSYENCFTGEEASKWIQEQMDVTPEKSIQIGQTVFMNRGAFYSISKKHTSFHAKSDVLYRFRIHDSSMEVLNTCKTVVNKGTEDAYAMSFMLAEKVSKILHKFAGKDGSIDFQSIKDTMTYFKFILMTTRLQQARVSELKSEERLAFLMNIHNVLTIHGHMVYGKPTNGSERKALAEKSYKIDGQLLSIETIQYFLRGKLNHASIEELPKLFKKSLEVPFTKEIHFCLVNGSDTSASFEVYSTNTEEEIRTQTLNFLLDHVEIQTDQDQIWLPKVFKEFGKDFGEREEILDLLAKHLPSQKKYIQTYKDSIELKYRDNTYSRSDNYLYKSVGTPLKKE